MANHLLFCTLCTTCNTTWYHNPVDQNMYLQETFIIYICICIYNLSITQKVNLGVCFGRSGNATSADSRLEMSQSGMPWWRRHAELGPGVAESRH